MWVTMVSVPRLYFSALELRLHILCLSEHTPVMSISIKSHNPCCTCNAHMVITLCGDFMRNTCCVVVNVIYYCSYNLPSNPQKSGKTDTSNVSGKRIIALEEVDRKEKEEIISHT